MKRNIYFLVLITFCQIVYSQNSSSNQEVSGLSGIERECKLGTYWYHEQGSTLLIETVKKNIYANVEYVLQKEEFRAEINDTWTQYAPPLFWAFMNGNIEIVELLLKYGADPNFYTKSDLPTAFDAIEELTNDNYISLEIANQIKEKITEYGYQIKNPSKIKINTNMVVNEELRIRDNDNISSKILTNLITGDVVKIKELGKYEIIDNINSRWVKVEVQKRKDENIVSDKIVGWCYGGYLK